MDGAIIKITTEDNGDGDGDGDIRTVKEMDDAVSSMLSDGFLKLSVEERTNKLEEMHGVRSQAVEESPSFLRQSLRDFQNELDSMVLRNSHHKPPVNAYILMLEKRRRSEKLLQQQQQQQQRQRRQQQHTQDDAETIRKNHYALDDPDFRLRFLRCELFDVSRAVARFWNYLEHTRVLWGDIMLERPIGIEDVLRNKEDRKYLKEGFIQILPMRDRSGRRILTAMGNVLGDFHFMTIHRVVFLMVDYLTRDSAESQRLGAVVVEELHAFKNLKMHPKHLELFSESTKSLPTRFISLHLSIPDSIMARMLVNLWILKGYKDDPTGVIFHKGTVLETRYELGAFGIPTHLLPMTDTGNLKTNYLGQWIKIRKILERRQSKRRTTILGAPLLAEDVEGDDALDEDTVIVECPCLNDIVFRQGTPSWDNPGNAVFRDFMMEHFERKEERKRRDRDSGGGDSGSLAHQHHNAQTNAAYNNNEDQIFCDSLITEIQERRGGRFLEWNKKCSAWIQMKSDTKQQRGKIRQKVSIAIYHFGRNLATTLLLKRTASEYQSTGWRNAKRNATGRTVPSIGPSDRSIPSIVSGQQKSDDGYGGDTSSDDDAKHYAFCEGGNKSASQFENNPCCRGPSRKRSRDGMGFGL